MTQLTNLWVIFVRYGQNERDKTFAGVRGAPGWLCRHRKEDMMPGIEKSTRWSVLTQDGYLESLFKRIARYATLVARVLVARRIY